ncbi:MAG: S8 family serine peptidase [Actinomycetota bacterium]|nr:S8 family serine peptidase [Actinomycetota bacterium]
MAIVPRNRTVLGAVCSLLIVLLLAPMTVVALPAPAPGRASSGLRGGVIGGAVEGAPPGFATPPAATPPSTVQPSATPPSEPEADGLIVRFKDARISGKASAAVHARAGGRAARKIRGLAGAEVVELPEGATLAEAVAAYERQPEVAFVQPNYISHIAAIPNDTYFTDLWGLHNTGQSDGTTDADIDAPEAWDITTGSSDIVVAVIDTGVDYNHPDLADNMWRNPGETAGNGIDDDLNGYVDDIYGYDFVNEDGNPMDDHGHGTHVSGTVGATGNNATGVTGVNWDVSIMAIKAGDRQGGFTSADEIEAVNYARAMGADVVNCSWGGSAEDLLLRSAISSAGMTFACAAGNLGRNADTYPFYPAAFNLGNIISVAATDRNDVRASYSNYGVTSVDVAAPGSSIYSTVRQVVYGTTPQALLFSDSMSTLSNWWAPTPGLGTPWTTTTTSYVSPPRSASHMGYLNGEVADLILIPEFDLTNSGALLRFNLWIDMSEGPDPNSLADDDIILLWVWDPSNPAGYEWVPYYYFTGNSGGWVPIEILLNDFGSLNGVSIAFQLRGANASLPGQGVRIDDVQIYSTASSGWQSVYGYSSGTSMATPHVAGLAALMLARNPSLTTAQIRSIIFGTVDKKAGLTGAIATGGRVNAYKAVVESVYSPPVVTDNAAAYYLTQPAVIRLTATDTASGVASIAYKVDGAATQTVPASAVNVSVSNNGSHSIRYTATDKVGYTSVPVTTSFIIDTIAPTASHTPVTPLYSSTPVTVTLDGADTGGSGFASMNWQVDGGAPQSSPTTPVVVPLSTEAAHTVSYWTIDNAGNTSVVGSAAVTIDATAPGLSDDVVASYEQSATIHLSATDGVSGVAEIAYRLDDEATQTVAGSAASFHVDTGNAHHLVYTATDRAGNVAPAQEHDFMITGALPKLYHLPGTPLYSPLPVDVTIDASYLGDFGIGSIHWQVDGGLEQSWPGVPATVSVAGEGQHTVSYWAVDGAGFLTVPKTADVTIDSIAPTAWTNVSSTARYADAAIVNISTSDGMGSGVASVSYRWDDETTVTVAGSSATAPTSKPGAHVLRYRAVDRAGNVVEGSKSIVVYAVKRLADATRYSTAIKIARETFAPAGSPAWAGVTDVVIASGEDRAAADPLSAAGLCWLYDAPLFLVSAKSTPAEVKAAIREIVQANGAVTVHVVGGTTSVPDARVADIKAACAPYGTVTSARVLASGNRYDLAATIARNVKSEAAAHGKTIQSAVFVANGADPAKFFDALALSPISSAKGVPILLVSATSVPSATRNALVDLAPAEVIVGGGVATVDPAVYKAVGADDRWSGSTRYTTAIDIANNALARGWLKATPVALAAKLPDALTGGSMVGREGGVLMLTGKSAIDSATGSWISSHKGPIGSCYVLGGTASVSVSVVTAARNLLK